MRIGVSAVHVTLLSSHVHHAFQEVFPRTHTTCERWRVGEGEVEVQSVGLCGAAQRQTAPHPSDIKPHRSIQRVAQKGKLNRTGCRALGVQKRAPRHDQCPRHGAVAHGVDGTKGKRNVHEVLNSALSACPQHDRAWLNAKRVPRVDKDLALEHVMVVACPHVAAHPCTGVVRHPHRVSHVHRRAAACLRHPLMREHTKPCQQDPTRREQQPGQCESIWHINVAENGTVHYL